MASVALGIAGSAIPGAGVVLGPLFSMVGSYIDRKFIFKEKKPDTPQVGDIQLQNPNEGGPLWWPLSNKTRVAGSVIALSDLVVEQTSESSGGKLTNSKLTAQHYYVDVAVAFAGREVFAIPQIWANGQLIFKTGQDPSEFTSDQFQAERVLGRIGTDEDGDPILGITLRIYSYSGGPDFQTFATGRDITVSGFGAPAEANNGTFQVTLTGLVGGRTFVQMSPYGDYVNTNPGEHTVTLSQVKPDFASTMAEDVRIYTGTTTQTQDPSIQDLYGTDIPAFRETAYVVFERLLLDEFGGQLPQFNGKVEATELIQSNAEIITEILTNRGGLDPSWYDVSTLGTGDALSFSRGYVIGAPQSTADALRPLMVGHSIGVSERDGQLFFYDRGDEETITVTDGDLAARPFGAEASFRPVLRRRSDRAAIPNQVNVKYLDSSKGMQPGQQTERAFSDNAEEHIADVDLPLVMGASNARKIARRILWDAITQSVSIEFTLPPEYMAISSGDRVTLTDEGEDLSVIVTEIDMGADFILACNGFVEQSQTSDVEDGTSDDPVSDPDDGEVPSAPAMVFYPEDMPTLAPEHVSVPGYYMASCLAEKDAAFLSATVYQSLDNVTFSELATLDRESTVGTAIGNFLGDGPVGYWDDVNSLQVYLSNGTVGSTTEISVLNGSNLAYYGREIIAFTTTNLESDGSYTISHLLRGLMGTEDFTSGHIADEVFCLITTVPPFVTLSVSDIGVTRYWKAVAAGGTADDATVISGIPRARNMKPISPFRVRGYRDGSDDVVISWERRTRSSVRFFAFMTAPLSEESEAYTLKVYDDGTYTTVVRTQTITAAKEYTYTSAAQSGDGLTPGDPVYVEVFQVSATVGDGVGRRGVV